MKLKNIKNNVRFIILIAFFLFWKSREEILFDNGKKAFNLRKNQFFDQFFDKKHAKNKKSPDRPVCRSGYNSESEHTCIASLVT